MRREKVELMTTGNIAKELGVSDAKIKKIIKELGIKPVTKKGVCNYYSRAMLEKIKPTLK